MVIEVIDWYKKYRDILNADIIRLRRADGRDWDGWMHVDPKGKEKALIMLFNPTSETMKKELALPLYYTGLSDSAKIRVGEGKGLTVNLDRNYAAKVTVDIPASGYTWLVVE